MFTSCSPAWIKFVETHYPDLIPHLSTCKSPQQMVGALIREIYPQHAGLERQAPRRRLASCRARPRSSRRRTRATWTSCSPRASSSTSGAASAWTSRASTEQAPLDAPFAEATGAGRLFAGSGGVMEAAVRTAHLLVTGEELAGGPKVTEARGSEGRAPLHRHAPATRA